MKGCKLSAVCRCWLWEGREGVETRITQGCDRYTYFGSLNQIQNQIRLVGSLGSDRFKDTIPLWENGKFCISEPDADPNWVGSSGSARYMWRYVPTLELPFAFVDLILYKTAISEGNVNVLPDLRQSCWCSWKLWPVRIASLPRPLRILIWHFRGKFI